MNGLLFLLLLDVSFEHPLLVCWLHIASALLVCGSLVLVRASRELISMPYLTEKVDFRYNRDTCVIAHFCFQVFPRIHYNLHTVILSHILSYDNGLCGAHPASSAIIPYHKGSSLPFVLSTWCQNHWALVCTCIASSSYFIVIPSILYPSQ